jgi:hypothetical protein
MSEQQQSTGASVAEMTAIHAISASLVTIFFRVQASNDSYWQAGDESLIANGVGAVIDIIYWLVKPRILKWRNG